MHYASVMFSDIEDFLQPNSKMLHSLKSQKKTTKIVLLKKEKKMNAFDDFVAALLFYSSKHCRVIRITKLPNFIRFYKESIF